MKSLFTLLLVVVFSFNGLNDCFGQDSEKVIWSSFSVAKKRARDVIYKDKMVTFYCQCEYVPSSTSGGKINVDDCGYEIRKSDSRGNRLEWEHVVPASFFGNMLPCWTEGHPDCKKKGRGCCGKVNEAFHEAEVDLHNLVPSVGEINGDRSNHPYGEVEEEERVYGTCDFELGGEPKKAEPRPEVRGDIARIWFYMIEFYDVPITEERLKMFIEWDKSDPITEWEIERNNRIKEIQGNGNPYIEGKVFAE